MNTEAVLKTLRKYPLAIIALAIAAVFGGAISMRSGNLPLLEEENRTLEREANLVERNTINAVNLAEDVEKLRELDREIEERLILPGQRAINQDYFYQTAFRTAVQIVQFRQMSETEQESLLVHSLAVPLETYDAVSFELKANGSFGDILQFLVELRRGTHFTRINSLETDIIVEDGRDVLQLALQVDVLAHDES